jgi:hypothetical protein
MQQGNRSRDHHFDNHSGGTMMRRIGIGGLTLGALLAAFALLRAPGVASGQVEDHGGWLEGTVRDENGTPLNNWRVALARNGSEAHSGSSAGDKGGLYEIRDIAPGVYEVRVTGEYGDRAGELRQQRIYGVLIKGGVRSKLNIVLKEGRSREFQEVGQPEVPTQNVVMISLELELLKAQVADLQNRIEGLEKRK